MSNAAAVVIVLALVALFAADWLHFGWDLHILLGRMLDGTIETMAFWR